MKLTSKEASPERAAATTTTTSKRDGCDVKGDAVYTKTQSEPSESQIQWIDPAEEEEREKLAVRLSAETQAQRFASGTEEVRFSLKPWFKGLKIALQAFYRLW